MFWRDGGSRIESRREPSSGGIGSRLNTARMTFSSTRAKNSLPANPDTTSSPLGLVTRRAIAARMATSTLDTGPARPTMAAPARRRRIRSGLNGVGRPQPKPPMIRKRVPSGSRWEAGLRVSRPCDLAVKSPCAVATAAWLNSWTVMPITTATTNATKNCGSSRNRNRGEPTAHPPGSAPALERLRHGRRSIAAPTYHGAAGPAGVTALHQHLNISIDRQRDLAPRTGGTAPRSGGRDHLVDQWWRLARLLAEAQRGAQLAGGVRGGLLVAGEDAADALARVDLVAELDGELDRDRGVDLVLLAPATGSEGGGGPPDRLGVDRGEPAGPRRGQVAAHGRLRQQGEVVEHPAVAALGGHELVQLLQAGAAIQRLGRPLPAFLGVRRDPGEGGQVTRKGEAEVEHAAAALAAQDLHRLAHLDRVADQVAERLVHVGDQRGAAPPGRLPEPHAGVGQLGGGADVLHEGARAGLDVEQDAARSPRQLLAHHARGDQRGAGHRGGHVAQRVDGLVGRDQRGALRHHRQPDALDLVEQLLDGQLHPQAGDGLQLVERASGVAEATAGQLQHLHADGGGERPDDQGGAVGHAAGGVLVDRRPGPS